MTRCECEELSFHTLFISHLLSPASKLQLHCQYMSFENEAREERAYYDSLSIAEIHTLIHERKFGRTGMLWQSLRERGNLVQSAWVLLELLDRRSVDRDTRRQAAVVLLYLLDSHEWSPEALSDDKDPDFESRMRDVRNAVNSKIREITR